MTLADLIALAGQATVAIIKAVAEASSGKITPDQAAAAIHGISDTMARFQAEDAAADASLDDKFPTGEGE